MKFNRGITFSMMNVNVYSLNIIPADALAANADRASSGMILTFTTRIFWLLHYKGNT